MADNYLEKQQELYQMRKAAWERTKKYGKKTKSKQIPSVKSDNTTKIKE